MSGPGDISGEVSGDEAAWRDLVARFDRPVEPEAAETPWPPSENIPDAAPAAGADPLTAQDQPGPRPAGTLQSYDSARVIRPAGDPRSRRPVARHLPPWAGR